MHTWYEIRIKGHLDLAWSDWFDGLTVTHDEDGNTTVQGPVVDQAALYGLIGRARDLGLSLLTVRSCEASKVNIPTKPSPIL